MGTTNSNFLPASTGLNLGSSPQRWNASLQNLDVAGNITGNPVFTGNPVVSGTLTVTGTLITTSLNGVLNATQFPGADIGAQVNAAIATLGSAGGTVVIPSGSYNFSTTIVTPRKVSVVGSGAANTTLNYTASTGWAMVVGDSMGATTYPQGQISDLTLIGPGSGSATGGIYLGGSAGGSFNGVASPSTIINPAGNFGDHYNVNRVRIFNGFGVGYQTGNNTWSTTLFESLVSNNGVNVYVAGIAGSGERIGFVGCSFQNASGVSFQVGDSNNTDVHCLSCSFDYSGSWAIKHGTSGSNALLTLQGCHIEQPDHWLQNFAFCNLIGCDFVNGTNSVTLGYLIDNQNQGLTVVGGTFFNNGAGAISNPAGQSSVWLGTTANTAINTNSGTNADKFGNFATQAISLGGKISGYGGAVTAGNGVPSEPFQILLGALVANYNAGAAKTIFTPATSSILRITATEYSQNTPTGASLPSLTLSWTDSSNTAQTLALLAVTGAVGAAGVYATNYAATTAKGGIQAVISTNTNTAVQVTSAGYVAGGGTALQYGLFVTVEVL